LRKESFESIVFDVDDTLYRRSDPYVRAYQKCFQKQIRTEKSWPDGFELYRISRVYGEEEYLRRVSGEIDMKEMLIRRTLRSFGACGICLTEEEALHFEETYEKEQSNIQLIPQFEAFFDILVSSGQEVFLGILTNGPSGHQRNKIHALGLTRWIPEEHIVVSGDIGVSKPELKAFRIYEKKCCIRPENTIMVGDNLDADIQGAEAAGWNALWVKI
jgi:putative hydrolase of the HAD superfamily